MFIKILLSFGYLDTVVILHIIVFIMCVCLDSCQYAYFVPINLLILEIVASLHI